ncbi:MAG: hypothetical protein EZS26_001464 [Candidatus Ordinivivax streblomastigis]|uniref:NfeD-like C-terminal domain-containing protein n=1 Tax=Candidatus Ordinivivax streblomastigis TaxID=2540710 RepID=A0A5M8P1Q4_9BACT|nr:MAG: hypothetical protein EZS26_001464 [Candidatus Ordinivivax streblomastigis]
MEWFNTLDPVLQMYWVIAGVTSFVFVIQMIMTFIGMDAEGMDADLGGDASGMPFQFFSLRNLVNFLLGFGWGGVCFYDTFESQTWVAGSALLTGLAFVLLFFFIVTQFLRLGRDNTFQISETLGQTANVYLIIPENKAGRGKIQISVRGAYHEIDALTEGDRIPTGDIVRVEQVVDNETVLVVKI